MAKSTKNTYKPSSRRSYKRVEKMELGGNVSELGYSERNEYIEENYAPFITDAQMIFSIYGSGLEYDYKADRKEVVNKIINFYNSKADYNEETLEQDTVYKVKDWDLVRREYDPETDEYFDDVELEMISSDNTYNFSYLGLVSLNWRVYYDADFEKYFYVIMPHLGGDIRGNYGNAIILEGNDKDELFYRFYEDFVSGMASIYFKFVDGSEVSFDSEQDSDVFSFRVSEVFEPKGMAEKYVEDFEKFDSWKGDEFLEATIDLYLIRNGQTPKMMSGGMLKDETPSAYIQILGYDEGKWIDLSEFEDGNDVLKYISNWMKQLNKEHGGNREEYAVHDYEGFGKSLYDEYMGVNEFDEIIEAYKEYEDSDFNSEVISAYINEVGKSNDSLIDVIQEMQNNYFGKYDSYSDFARSMISEGVYTPSINDVYMTDTTKRVLAGEETDAKIDNMGFNEMLDKTELAKTNYIEEKESLERQIDEIQENISNLKALRELSSTDDEYERVTELIVSNELQLEDTEKILDDIDSRYEDDVRNEAYNNIYNEIYDQLDNDLSGWLEENEMTDEFEKNSIVSIDYDAIGDEISSDYLVIDNDGELYFFNNYKKGGRIYVTSNKPKHQYYIVESITKKLVSGYDSKEKANEQRKLLIQEYPSMRFEIFTLGNLEKKTDLDVYSKKDYVELSTLDKIKQVSVDAYRYGEEKVGQANEFLKRHDVKGRFKRGARKVWDKTKQGASWLQRQWREADFGDGKGKAKFFADGGEINNILASFEKDGETFELIAYYNNGEIHFESVQNRLKGDDKEVIETYYDEVEALREFENLKQELNATRSSIDRTKHWTETSAINLIYYHFNQPFNFKYIIDEEGDDVLDLSDILYELEKKGEKYKCYSLSEYERALQNKEVRDFLNNLLIKYGDKLDESYANGGYLEYIDSKYSEKDAEKLVKELKESGNYRRVQMRKNKRPTHTPTGKVSKRGSAGIFWRIYAEPLFADGGEMKDSEIRIVAERVNKDGVVIERIQEFFNVSAKNIDEAKEIAKNLFNEDAYLRKYFQIIEVLSREELRLKYPKGNFADGGGVGERQNIKYTWKQDGRNGNDKLYVNNKYAGIYWSYRNKELVCEGGDYWITFENEVFKNGNKTKRFNAYKDAREYVYSLMRGQFYADGGGVESSEVLTMPRPVTTPAPTKTPAPSKPDRNNPYKPKTTPKPKASKYDYIWIVE